ncbi:MAG: hypothetical protein ACD_3C00073G0003 [uncultured bacterium (gcode 4)]|uniref:Uncharacterized protein n=1 Tax=uncultured bacterium (gcode 4) TaxID=1234023 RepID=K2FB40_9BACT|nr:MAG: hypothetical protein ACD_3C00073G0003 [uncultured bacterium (gcode 4)]
MGWKLLTIPNSRLQASSAKGKVTISDNSKRWAPAVLKEKREEYRRRANEALMREWEEAIDKCYDWLEKYEKIIFDHFPMWSKNLESDKKSQLRRAIYKFGSYLYDIHLHQDDNLKLYNAPIDTLGLDEKLHKAIICFLLDPFDSLNGSLMLDFIRDLDDENTSSDRQEMQESNEPEMLEEWESDSQGETEEYVWEDLSDLDPDFLYLSVYLELILQATQQNIENWNLPINMSFMDKVKD